MLYRIVWKSSNGVTGGGEYCLDYSSATRIITSLNKSYSDVHHWIEANVPDCPEFTYTVLGGA
jgi:hypothetical protein